METTLKQEDSKMAWYNYKIDLSNKRNNRIIMTLFINGRNEAEVKKGLPAWAVVRSIKIIGVH